MDADPSLCKIIPGGSGGNTRRCCWYDLDENGNEVRICETCTDPGDGSYINCKRTTIAAPFTPLPGPGCSQFGCAPTPGPAHKTSLVRHSKDLHREVSSKEICGDGIHSRVSSNQVWSILTKTKRQRLKKMRQENLQQLKKHNPLLYKRNQFYLVQKA